MRTISRFQVPERRLTFWLRSSGNHSPRFIISRTEHQQDGSIVKEELLYSSTDWRAALYHFGSLK